jgi:hypothetical protein
MLEIDDPERIDALIRKAVDAADAGPSGSAAPMR